MTNEQIESELKHLASKEDVANLRADTKADLANLRAELHDALSVQLKWIIGLLIAQSGLLIAILHR